MLVSPSAMWLRPKMRRKTTTWSQTRCRVPELPEVESLVRDLSPTLVGRTIQTMAVSKPELFSATPGLSLEDVFGRRIEHLWRRGKLTIWELSDGVALVATRSRRGIPLGAPSRAQWAGRGRANFYRDECLRRARVNPRRTASSLSDAEITRRQRATRAVLDSAVRAGAAFVPHGKAIS